MGDVAAIGALLLGLLLKLPSIFVVDTLFFDMVCDANKWSIYVFAEYRQFLHVPDTSVHGSIKYLS